MVKVRGQFKRRSTANNVEIYVPVPDDADSPKFRVGSLCWQRQWLNTDIVTRHRSDRSCMLQRNRRSYGRSSS